MDIRQLRRFVAVAELGSFNKAAELLAISQPSLTRSIQLLEESLDSRLFERGPRGISLTPIGEELLPHARVILNEQHRALSTVRSLKERMEEMIAIGTEPAFAVHRLPLALARIAVTHPHVQATVKEGSLQEMLDQVREGSLRFVLGSRAPYLDLTGIAFEPLVNESASILLRADHPLVRAGKTELQHLVRARWIVSDNEVIREGWARMFEKHDLPRPEIAVRTSSLQLTKSCLLFSDLVSLGDETSFADEIGTGHLVRINVGGPRYERPAGLFRRDETGLSASEKAFIAALRDVCREEKEAGAGG